MSFRNAVRATPPVSVAYRPGLQALREIDRKRVSCRDSRKVTGSLDLDGALKAERPHEPRWDYGIGYREGVVWVEVHPASSSHIGDVIAKHDWLKAWLRDEAPRLHELPREFVWVASGAVSLPPGSPQRRRLAQAGIRFAGSHLALE